MRMFQKSRRTEFPDHKPSVYQGLLDSVQESASNIERDIGYWNYREDLGYWEFYLQTSCAFARGHAQDLQELLALQGLPRFSR